jgi:hypothetical protein
MVAIVFRCESLQMKDKFNTLLKREHDGIASAGFLRGREKMQTG